MWTKKRLKDTLSTFTPWCPIITSLSNASIVSLQIKSGLVFLYKYKFISSVILFYFLKSLRLPVFCSFSGNETSPESFLLHNALARKPKRIRTAFSPSQLLRLEHAFEKNHYVVGAERKQLAHSLSLTETQVRKSRTF